VIPIKQYLTPEDYEIAESNGISERLVYERFYINDWTAERAITQPVKRKGKLKKLVEEAHSNGIMISRSGMQARMRKMSDYDAVNTPLRESSSEYVAIAEENGISRQAYYSRRKRGWDKELASTWPVGKSRKEVAVKPTASDDLSESEIARILNIEVGSPHNSWF